MRGKSEQKIMLSRPHDLGLGMNLKPSGCGKGLNVSAVHTNGIAAKAGGIRTADTITKVNNIDITSLPYEDSLRLLTNCTGTKLDLTVTRNGEEYKGSGGRNSPFNAMLPPFRSQDPENYYPPEELSKYFSKRGISTRQQNGQYTLQYPQRNPMGQYERHSRDRMGQTNGQGMVTSQLNRPQKVNNLPDVSRSLKGNRKVRDSQSIPGLMDGLPNTYDTVGRQQAARPCKVTSLNLHNNPWKRRSLPIVPRVGTGLSNGHSNDLRNVNGYGTTTFDELLNGARVGNDHQVSPEVVSGPKSDPEATCEGQQDPQALRHLLDETKNVADTLHLKANKIEPNACTQNKCIGSILNPPQKKPYNQPRPQGEVIKHAHDFYQQYFAANKKLDSSDHQKRWHEVLSSIQATGTYHMTTPELTFGVKTAWRNAPRCIGRIQWNKIQVFDARHVRTAEEMFEAICTHLKYGTNNGFIRSAITVFPARTDGQHDYKVWNSQLIRYAGYQNADGTVTGDPASIEITKVLLEMGWHPKRTMFDILPLILQADGQDPQFFVIPEELVLQVPIRHPRYPWFEDLGLQWYALPAVANMTLDCGGLEFTGAPFNGWYMSTEIGCRNLCDTSRYNLTEVVAKKMGLDTGSNSTLWKDRAMLEMNEAVLHSYQSKHVTLVDHHTASETFMKHMENETAARGGCPADWVWIVPPMSGSLCPVFHQEMLNYKMYPCYEYQDGEPWKTYIWKGERPDVQTRLERQVTSMSGKVKQDKITCTILFATETGRSQQFAKQLGELFKHSFDARVLCMEDYNCAELDDEALLLIVASTFGNGEAPDNGEDFSKALQERNSSVATAHDGRKLSSVRFAVFGLGSSAYPNFCAFGKMMDRLLGEFGAERLHPVGEGDELKGQEDSFKKWSQEVYKVACNKYCCGDGVKPEDAVAFLSSTDRQWLPNKYRLIPVSNHNSPDICNTLSQMHNKHVVACKLLERQQLQTPLSGRQTILCHIDTSHAESMDYQPGDHLAIFPTNKPDMVNLILKNTVLPDGLGPDDLVKVEVLEEHLTTSGSVKNWIPEDQMAVTSVRLSLTHILDITTPPSRGLLAQMVKFAADEGQQQKLDMLSKDNIKYEEWKQEMYPHLGEVLEEFPSLRLPATFLLTQLPLLQQRFYSISSCPKLYPGQVHVTIAVVKFAAKGKKEHKYEGLCSSMMNNMEAGTAIHCFIRKAPKFRLPEDQSVPILMVGPGTAIAPFRSFWQQRMIDMQQHIHNKQANDALGPLVMYFGCRATNLDHIYRKELEEMRQNKVLTEVHVALSRQPGVPKTYVQDLLHYHSNQVYNQLVKQGGHLYVCGDSAMAKGVCQAVEDILTKEAGMVAVNAKKYIEQLRESNRYHEDVFNTTVIA